MSLEEVYLQPTGWWRGSLGSPESELTTVVGQRLQDRVTWPGIGKLRASHRGAGGPHYGPGTAAGLASREPSTGCRNLKAEKPATGVSVRPTSRDVSEMQCLAR